MIDFTHVGYLKGGNDRQQRAHDVLEKLFQPLAHFSPVLVGTIPIAIDIASSDLDIACHYEDSVEFSTKVKQTFGTCDGFHLKHITISGVETVLAVFHAQGFEIEIFGQPIPVTQQNGYRHMLIEYKILERKGEKFRQQIIALKKSGLKTEPAFARLLGLEGDPYQKLLDYESVLE